LRHLPAPSTAVIALLCPFCGAEQEVEVTAIVRPGRGRPWGGESLIPPDPPSLEDVTPGPLPATCWACRAPHIDRDLAPKLAARLDALTVEDFR